MARPNNIEFATLLQNSLDQQMVQGLLTGFMDSNAGDVKYQGGNEVKIPTIALDGLGNYKRNAGTGDSAYSQGAINLTHETYKMTKDRARKFVIDAMDVDESNFQTTATKVMNLLQKEHVIPEIDAYRLSVLAQTAITTGQVEYSYTPSATDVILKIKEGIKTLRENNFNGELVCYLTYDTMFRIQENTLNMLSSTTFNINGIDTRVPAIDGVPLIETSQNRLYTKIDLLDGETVGQEQGGYQKAGDGKDINFLIVAKTVPVAVTKQDLIRIFDPKENQSANAYSIDYRRYHDLWVVKSKEKGIFINVKDAN